MDPNSKKEGHCDITAHTVLLYVLFCLIYMYCTLYVLYILHTVHVPCFPVSDVEVSSSTSVRALVQIYKCSLSHSVALHLTISIHARLVISASSLIIRATPQYRY